jgi:pimeloyl-ACP methyl ester carboxylesterase
MDRLSEARMHLCYHAPAERHVPRPQRIDRLGGTSLQGHEFERMGFTSELRHPTTWYTQLAIAVLALVLFAVLAVGAVSGYLVYRMESPARSHSEIDLQNFPGHPEKLTFTVTGEGPRDGWFFPGLKSAPTIVMCPGYESSRGELLTLASALQDQQYNVLAFDFSAHGSAGGRSTLGLQEVAELRAAMNAVANRGDVDANRFGLWGVNLGAYVALAEATSDRRVRAIAAESPYGHPKDMVALQVRRSGLGSLPFVTRMSQMIFGWLNSKFRDVPPLNTQIGKLSGVAQLYLESPDDPALAAPTSDLFRVSSPPHELVVLQHGNYGGMLDDEKRNYENRIVSFFLVNLPPAIEGSSHN